MIEKIIPNGLIPNGLIPIGIARLEEGIWVGMRMDDDMVTPEDMVIPEEELGIQIDWMPEIDFLDQAIRELDPKLEIKPIHIEEWAFWPEPDGEWCLVHPNGEKIPVRELFSALIQEAEYMLEYGDYCRNCEGAGFDDDEDAYGIRGCPVCRGRSGESPYFWKEVSNLEIPPPLK